LETGAPNLTYLYLQNRTCTTNPVIESITGIKMAPATVSNMLDHVSDSMTGEIYTIIGRVETAYTTGFDETKYKDSGRKAWTNVAQSSKDIAND